MGALSSRRGCCRGLEHPFIESAFAQALRRALSFVLWLKTGHG